MTSGGVKSPGRGRVPNPHSGGRPVPVATQAEVRRRVVEHAREHYAGRFIGLDVRFRGALCYIDAFQEPSTGSEVVAGMTGETPEEFADRIRKTPLHLARIRHFDLERWSLAFFAYSSESYVPCRFPDGEWYGTVEQAFDVGAGVYL